MATEETGPSVFEDPLAAPVISEPAKEPVAVDADASKAAESKAKEAKPKAARKPRAPVAHPPYFEMISEAISSMKERTGSSQYAITKFIEDKHKDKLPVNFKKIVFLQLKNFAAAGKLTKVKNSFKIPSAPATKPKPAAKKPAVKPKAAAAVSKSKPNAKAKPAAAKPKSKTVSKAKAPAKRKAAPAKAAKTTPKDTPAKKAPPLKKAAAPAKKPASAKKAAAVKKGKAATPLRKVPARKARK